MTEVTTRGTRTIKRINKTFREGITTYNEDHRLYSKFIANYDRPLYMSDIAASIASDIKFDEQCRRSAENRKKYKERKAMGIC